MSKPFVAVLDTCVLYPVIIRDTLLRAAEAGAYQLRWTEEILLELRRNLVSDRGAPAERVDRMLAELAESFDDGKVSGHERHLPSLRNDPKDRHIVAAAIEGGAELIVTANLKHFSPEVMPDGIRAMSADEFLLELLERVPAAMVDVVWLQATQKKRPPMSVWQVLESIGRSAPGFVKAIRPFLDVRTVEQRMAVAERLERALPEQPGMGDLDELSVALSDARVLSPQVDEMVERKARALAPLAIRQLAKELTSNDERKRAATADTLRTFGIDPEGIEVAGLTDDQILALLDRARSISQ